MENFERLGTLTQKQLAHSKQLTYMRYLSCLVAADGMDGDARYRFGMRFPRDLNCDLVTKAAVAVGTTTDATWAGPLAPLTPLTDEFLEFIRPKTMLGKIQNLRRVPFNISIASETTGGTYTWAGQNKPKPVTKADLATVNFGFAKAVGIIVVSEELAKLSQPGADVFLRDELGRGIAQFLDTQFVDPAVAEVANVSPGSITNGATSIAASGTTTAAFLTDIKALIASFTTANPDVEFAVLLMTPSHAAALAVATNSQTLTIAGGTIFGIPVVTSTVLSSTIVICDAAGILVADNNDLEISVSRNATVQMDTAPTDPTVAATVLISLFQQNLVGFRVDRTVNWKRARASAVRYISGAAYV